MISSVPRTSPVPRVVRGRRRRAAGVAAVVGVVAAAAVPVADARYATRPDLKPTTVRVAVPPSGTAPGLIFTTPKGGGVASGAMAFDQSGELVWFQPARKGRSILDLKPQTLDGRPVLTYWEGKAQRGSGTGAFRIVDQQMHPIAEVSPKGRRQVDFHEFTLTPQGTALTISYKPVRGDTRAVRGGARNDLVMRNLIQEVDVRTNEVLWEWDATKAVSPAESYLPIPKRPEIAYDFIHANSVNLDTDGNVLVSSRHTHTVYKIDKATKKIVWKLGGKRSSFRMGKGARFAWQHDAHRQPDGTITMFDNVSAVEDDPGKRSRGLQLRLDEAGRTATVVRSFVNAGRKVNNTQGNLQALPTGTWFVGWGGTGNNVSEFSADGTRIFEARYASKRTESYRAYRAPWTSQPTTAPKAVARRSGSRIAVRASWNGATTVASWRVLGGATANDLRPLATAPRSGFETLLLADGAAGATKVVAVEALDAQDAVLGRSRTLAVGATY